MITRELLKAEIDKVQDGYLEILYRIIQALIKPFDMVTLSANKQTTPPSDWQAFVEQTYGSLADDPIERAPQGKFEVREIIE